MEKSNCFKKVKDIVSAVSISYMVSILFLFITTIVMYYTNVSEKIISGMIMGTYFLSCMVGGFVVGKNTTSRKFLWGMLSGIIYTMVICLISMIISKGICDIKSIVIVLLLTIFGGMIGGMIS